MNTTEKGNSFEDKVYTLLMKEIENFNTFINPKNHISVTKKKRIYSEEREGNIEFDIVIEVYQNKGVQNLSQLIVVECKDYSGSVGIDQVNKFLGDIDDIRKGNYSYGVKPIMAISSRLARGAYNKVKNKGVGLIKINEDDELKWIFNRSFKSEGINQNLDLESIFVDDDLPTYHGSSWFFYTQDRWFNSFQDYLYFLTGQPRTNTSIKYHSKEDLEEFAEVFLKEVDYLGGEVSQSELLQHTALQHIKLYQNVTPNKHDQGLLGRIDFENNEVFIYRQEDKNEERDRFTLAHELAHILLQHNRYLSKDTLGELDASTLQPVNDTMIAKLEFQANYLASCLLVPKNHLIDVFFRIYQETGLKRRGRFWIYLDDQPINKLIAHNMVSKLARYFNVSKSVIKIRLIQNKLLHDRQ